MSKAKTVFYTSDTEGLDEIAEALLNEEVGTTERTFSVEANINPKEYIKIPNESIVISREEQHKGSDWTETHYALADNGLFMPPPALFMPYFVNVRDAAQGKITLYTADNQPVLRDEAEDLWKYLSSGHRGGCLTWLDAKFEQEQDKWKIKTNHIVETQGTDKQLKPLTIEDLETCIREDSYVGLQFNSQGLPTQKSGNQEYKQGENIRYWHPRNGAVAGFWANSDRAGLNCGRNPQGSSSSLGVFSCAEGTQKN